MVSEITEINLSYLILAQQLIRADRPMALFRLGISEQVAELIESLKPSQMLKIASGSTLMCRLRVDDSQIWGLLADHARAGQPGQEKTAERLHANILMAGRYEESV
ncbi:MAG: flagellar transcriptional regulator FlhD [Burkholderiaceae bacterium]